ncbi:hypothetical protein K501DRAFT_338326 [Backusella circina FSU 941]|nr:hypothetical protein K501DRAFT_338326 [Backusella circina FSU 941]
MATQQYEFQPPVNMVAIRSSIMRRIQNKRKEEVLPATPTTPTTTEKTLPRHLDNGLPSPPCDSDKDKPVDSEMVVNALLELSSRSNQQQMEPPSPVLSQSKSTPSSPGALDPDAIRQKIKELEQEKHKLFQVMKDLLSQPSLKEEQEEKPEKERARSQSREKTSSRPAIRSRSISHSEYRPARYGGNYHRSPSRFYSYDNRYAYPSSSRSYPLVSPMPRRVPYVSSRSQPPARLSSSFRRPDRHLPRY